MSTTLGKAANGAVALALVFGLATCGESAADLQRKTELVDFLKDRAVATCQIQDAYTDQIPYIQRLEDVLAETKTGALDYFKENGIVICLDKRLQGQKDTFWGDDAEGIYYPAEKVISLLDNGKSEADRGFFEYSAATRGQRFLNRFEDTFGGWNDKYDTLAQVVTPLFAHHYTTGGKHKTTHYKWHDGAQRNMHVVFDNQPFLRDAPVAGLR